MSDVTARLGDDGADYAAFAAARARFFAGLRADSEGRRLEAALDLDYEQDIARLGSHPNRAPGQPNSRRERP